MHHGLRWSVIALVTLAMTAALGWQRLQTIELQSRWAETEVARARARQVRDERERLQRSLPSAETVAGWEKAKQRNVALQAEIDRIAVSVQAAEARVAASEQPAGFVLGRRLSAAEWRNAGSSTPGAAAETAFWAAAGGDIDALARLLVLDHLARPAAEAWFASLPAEVRAKHPTVERLIAFLTVRDVPVGSAQLVREQAYSPQLTVLQFRVEGPGAPARYVQLGFNRYDGWKLVVLPSVIEKYAAALKSGS